MPQEVNGVVRLDVTDPEDAQVLVHWPTFWQTAGPKTIEKAIQYLRDNPSEVDPPVLPTEVLVALA